MNHKLMNDRIGLVEVPGQAEKIANVLRRLTIVIRVIASPLRTLATMVVISVIATLHKMTELMAA